MKKITKIASVILSIMMLVAMMPMNVLAAELESRTLTVENNVEFKLAQASDNLPLQYVITLNGAVYTGEYELINKDGTSAGKKQALSDGTITLKTAQKAVIDVKLGDSYRIDRKQFVSNESFDGNYYNVIDAASKSGKVEDVTYYYCTENGKKSEITEEQYNAATNNGEVTKVEGYLVDGNLVAEAPSVTDIDGKKISYASGTLDTTSVTPIKVTTEEKNETISFKVFFKTYNIPVKYTAYIAKTSYNGKEYTGTAIKDIAKPSSIIPDNIWNGFKDKILKDASLGTEKTAAQIAFAQISFASDVKVALMPKANGVYPVYLMKEAQKVTREYTVDVRKNATETFTATATPALGGTASITVAYAKKNAAPVKVSNAGGSDVDYNYYTIDKEVSTKATSEKFALTYSTGIDFSDITIGGINIGALLENLVDMDALTSAKTSLITVDAGELGVTYTFYGLVKDATYEISPEIALDDYKMPSADSDGITSGDPIKFTMGAPGTNTVISNYVNYTAAEDASANTEDKIVVFEKEPTALLTKQNLQGEALAGAEFCMIERDKIVGMLETLASMDTNWEGVYEDLKAADWSNLSWNIVLDIFTAYMGNSSTEGAFELPAILKATSDENGQVKFNKDSNIFADLRDVIGDKVIDTAAIKDIMAILEKLGVELPEDIDSILNLASTLGKLKIECGMPLGKYILIETKAPEGYLDNPVVWTVEVVAVTGEGLEANNVRIGILYDVISEQLKENYDIDIENIVPETKFDENDAAIKEQYAMLEKDATEAIEYVYSMIGEYVEMPDKKEFTDTVIARLREGQSLAEAINYAVSYADGLLGRTMDEEFVIYNGKESDFEIAKQEEPTPGAPEATEPDAPQPEETKPEIKLPEINEEKVKEALKEVMENNGFNKLSDVLNKLISLRKSK